MKLAHASLSLLHHRRRRSHRCTCVHHAPLPRVRLHVRRRKLQKRHNLLRHTNGQCVANSPSNMIACRLRDSPRLSARAMRRASSSMNVAADGPTSPSTVKPNGMNALAGLFWNVLKYVTRLRASAAVALHAAVLTMVTSNARRWLPPRLVSE